MNSLRAVHFVKTSRDENFAIRLNYNVIGSGCQPKHSNIERRIEIAVLVQPRQSRPRFSAHAVESSGNQDSAVWLDGDRSHEIVDRVTRTETKVQRAWLP